MSRIGKQPIEIPSGNKVIFEDNKISCQGPKGNLSYRIDTRIKVKIEDDKILLLTKEKQIDKEIKALWGTTRAIINNIIVGINSGFEKKLEFNGVGYNVQVSGNKMILNLGFSHPIELDIPAGIEVRVDKNIIAISGFNKQEIGQFAARIRNCRKPEPYKGKGIKYFDEHIRRKAGKKAATTEEAAG